MILLAHIAVALASLVWTTFLWMRPTKAKFIGSYVLLGATLASGTYLVISVKAHILQACATGLVYVGVVSFGIARAHNKLAAEKVQKKA